MGTPSKKDDEQVVESRRGFLKNALVTAGAVAGFLGAVKFD